MRSRTTLRSTRTATKQVAVLATLTAMALTGTHGPATASASTTGPVTGTTQAAFSAVPATALASTPSTNHDDPVAARRSTAPVVNSVLIPEAAAVTSYNALPVLLDITVPSGVEVAAVYAQIAVDGVTIPEWELVAFGSTPDEYEKGTFPYDSSEHGIGDAQIVATRVRYYPAPNSAAVDSDQSITSNTMLVRQGVNMTGSVYRYTGSRASEVNVTASYYNVAKQEYLPAEGFEVLVEQQIVKKKNGKKKKVWVKVAQATLNGEGQTSTDFDAKSAAKSLYRLIYKGTSDITDVVLTTNSKI